MPLIDQNEQLKTWANQRDVILGEISVLNIEKENLIKSIKELGNSKTEIQEKIIGSVSRMQELDKQEKEYESILSVEVNDLEKKKTFLESKVSQLEEDVSPLLEKKDNLISDINNLVKVHDQVYKRSEALDQVIDRVTRVNEKNISDINSLVISLRDSVVGISEISKRNIAEINLVIGELPRTFFELKRKSLIKQ